MDEDQRKRGEQVDPKPDQQGIEEIESYWTPERQRGAGPVPLPTIGPAKKKKKEPQPSSSEAAEEIVVEPSGPDN